ncbi:hypothetical protein O1611_g3480 [Lasiodiplodia mahajangana]|uniref:Uncharacterized protein n=1 Tax=Lasiodiplodia mahajangana TaxID=1108764 RepID=A0ACC2JRS0_9PEZI|nr:hypothetical protein O1611_g3480 [Lasiodiplodia mahajangana]
MHSSTLIALLASACGTALCTPTPYGAAHAAKLPLPSRTIFQLNDSIPNSWFENIAIRRNGDLLVTMLSPQASLYTVQGPLSDSPQVSVIGIDNANGLVGIAETSPDVFAVAAGTFDALAAPVPGTMAVWEVDFNGPEPTTRLIANMPEAGFLNGVVTIPGSSSPAILVADNGISQVWRVDVKTGKYETAAANVPQMQPLPNATLPLGVNGVKIRDGNLYFSNSNLASIFRMPIDENGIAVQGAEAKLVAKFDADDIDDFLIDERGEYWAATNFENTVAVAKMYSTGVVVVGSPTTLTVAGDTALAFGRTEKDKNIVYVPTGGALARPVNGTVTEPAKIVAIDRSGFLG